MQVLAGIDIGGTKTALSFGSHEKNAITILHEQSYPTFVEDFPKQLAHLIDLLDENLAHNPTWKLEAIGISCGGPLDAQNGRILSPPNLPLWNDVNIVEPLAAHFKVPAVLRNDADACALAEWNMGAGRGSRHMVFLTFGTGMGAGLILNGRLYSGATALAGEVGHIRLADDGPVGYGKRGSFEGFCSGGGIARLGRTKAQEALEAGKPPLFCRTEQEIESISAKSIGEAAHKGDPLALEIYHTVAEHLGKGIAIIIDTLNVEKIVIGSIFVRQQALLEGPMWETIMQEALPLSAKACRIVPAGLGEELGNYAALSVALDREENY